jgi:hypothetical protein
MLAPVRYTASPALESFIRASAPPHFATPDAPGTLEGLQEWAASAAPSDPLPVYDGGCERTIFSTPAVNHAFRAWHDSLHLAFGLGFDKVGEYGAAGLHMEAAAAAGLLTEDQRALLFEVVGQFEYAAAHAGEFPADQALFVARCFAHGIRGAIRMGAC